MLQWAHSGYNLLVLADVHKNARLLVMLEADHLEKQFHAP